jgi:hypothetical protein
MTCEKSANGRSAGNNAASGVDPNGGSGQLTDLWLRGGMSRRGDTVSQLEADSPSSLRHLRADIRDFANRWIRSARRAKVAQQKGGGMRGRLWILVVGLLLTMVRVPGIAQEAEPDARTVVQAAVRAMGADNVKSITYSGTTGYVATPGQNYAPSSDWPANQIVSYTRTIDYDAKSSKLDYTLRQGTGQGGPAGGGNAPTITNPLVGDQRTQQFVSGNVAWNMNGTMMVPAPGRCRAAAARDLADAARLSQSRADAGRQSDRHHAQRAGQGSHPSDLVHGPRQVSCAVRDQRQESRRADSDVLPESGRRRSLLRAGAHQLQGLRQRADVPHHVPPASRPR